MSGRALEGIKVLDLSRVLAGPWSTQILADFGADVIKIEDPNAGGDVGRYVPPFNKGEDSLFFETFNRNKRSLALDLKQPEALEIVRQAAVQSGLAE